MKCPNSFFLDYSDFVGHINLRLQLKRYDVCCTIFSELCAHELKYKVDFEQQQYLFKIEHILRLKATAAQLQRLTQAQLMKIVMAPLQFKGASPLEPEHVRYCCVLCVSVGKKLFGPMSPL
jgi:hypothetical protein